MSWEEIKPEGGNDGQVILLQVYPVFFFLFLSVAPSKEKILFFFFPLMCYCERPGLARRGLHAPAQRMLDSRALGMVTLNQPPTCGGWAHELEGGEGGGGLPKVPVREKNKHRRHDL